MDMPRSRLSLTYTARLRTSLAPQLEIVRFENGGTRRVSLDFLSFQSVAHSTPCIWHTLSISGHNPNEWSAKD